jgi:ribose/xylose/arabinose/galactoside ABC-type transport system permease subunit
VLATQKCLSVIKRVRVSRELDLSVGYIVGLSQALVVGLMTLQGLRPPLVIVITIVTCAVIGLINGALVVKIGLNSLIVTLATGNVIYGLVLWYTAGTILFQGIPQEFLKISSGSLLYVPLPIWYAVLLIVIVELVLGYFPAGRRMYAVGGNRRAALPTGIAVDWIVIAAPITIDQTSGIAPRAVINVVAIAAMMKADPHRASAKILRCWSHESNRRQPTSAEVNTVMATNVGKSNTMTLTDAVIQRQCLPASARCRYDATEALNYP